MYINRHWHCFSFTLIVLIGLLCLNGCNASIDKKSSLQPEPLITNQDSLDDSVAHTSQVPKQIIKTPCFQNEDSDDWLSSFQRRIRDHDKIYQYLQKTHGPPSSCDGAISTRFEGRTYGNAQLAWDNGNTFTITSEPPETSKTELVNAKGFADEQDLIKAIQQATTDSGIPFSWENKTTQESTTGMTEEYSAGPSGINAFARFFRDKNNNLVKVTISMAL